MKGDEVMAKSKRSTRLFTGLIIGSALGAGLSLLFAPSSGEETRRMIKENVDDVKKKAESTVRNARDKVKSKIEEAETAAMNVADEVRSRAQYVKEKGIPPEDEPAPFTDYQP